MITLPWRIYHDLAPARRTTDRPDRGHSHSRHAAIAELHRGFVLDSDRSAGVVHPSWTAFSLNDELHFAPFFTSAALDALIYSAAAKNRAFWRRQSTRAPRGQCRANKQ